MMHVRTLRRAAGIVAMALTLVLAAQVSAAEQETAVTTIHIEKMHCGNCAQKIARRLYTVASVQQVKTNHKAGIAKVISSAEKQPVPRALWDAVVKAGFKPVKLVTPSAEFNGRPRS